MKTSITVVLTKRDKIQVLGDKKCVSLWIGDLLISLANSTKEELIDKMKELRNKLDEFLKEAK